MGVDLISPITGRNVVISDDLGRRLACFRRLHLVFCAPQGRFLRNLSCEWYPALKKAAIPDLRWHDTRHTAASRLVMAGVDLFTVKEILGHKTLAMTARYSHLSPGHQRQALERLADRQATPTGANGGEQVVPGIGCGEEEC